MGEPHRIGIVGLGVISKQYLATFRSHPGVQIVAVADLDSSRAELVAREIDGCRAMSVERLMTDPSVETVVNLTIPSAHAGIALAALARGKNVYGEKPFAVMFADAERIMAAAGSAWAGGAPDTVLGTGVQTARRVIDEGGIGRPISATATFTSSGPERWHPQPDFYYRQGGGPLLDMGPYYLTSLVHLLGPVVRVTGASSRPRETRIIESGPRAGERIPVDIDTHITGSLEHLGGAVSTVMFSFDAVATGAAPIEVHGESGSMSVPDPNNFDGDVRVFAHGGSDWSLVPPSAGYESAGRGIGVIDFARGHRRASGDLALHVLEIMTELLRSAREGRRIDLTTTADRPELVPFTSEREWREGSPSA